MKLFKNSVTTIPTISLDLSQPWMNSIKEIQKNQQQNNPGGSKHATNHIKQKVQVSGSFAHVDDAFSPYRLTLWLSGRFPFSPTITKSGMNIGYSDSLWSIHWLTFTLSTLYLAFVLIMCTLGFLNIFLNWNILNLNHSEDEKQIVKDNLVAFVLFWSCLFHSTVSNVSLFTNRKKVVTYLNHWNIVLDTMQFNVPRELRKFLVLSNIWYGAFLIIVLSSYAFNLHKIARGASLMVTTLSLRIFLPNVYMAGYGSYGGIYLFGLFTTVYGIYASRSILFIYLFKSRLLRHGFKVWNRRLKRLLDESDQNQDDNKLKQDETIICEKLYAEHYTLVSLVKDTDKVFGSILQSYYGSQILNMCFELYYLARFGSVDFKNATWLSSNADESDIQAAIVLLIQTVILFFTVSLDAAYVNEEAMKGFELLRWKGIRAGDSIPKKYLFYSLEMSFSQRIVLTGGKFFNVDRPFIITVLGAVFTYFIIILQFGIGTSSGGSSGNPVSNSTCN